MILFFSGVAAALAPSAIVFALMLWNDRKYGGRSHSGSGVLSFDGTRIKQDA
jgi:hypothetical protein